MAGLGVVICNHEGLVMASLSEVIQQPPTVIGMESFCSRYRFCLTQIKKNSKNIQFKKKKIILASFLAKLGQDKSKKKKKNHSKYHFCLTWVGAFPKKFKTNIKKLKKLKKRYFGFNSSQIEP